MSIASIGIDIGKLRFHLVALDEGTVKQRAGEPGYANGDHSPQAL